jgi:hypothetical protein
VTTPKRVTISITGRWVVKSRTFAGGLELFPSSIPEPEGCNTDYLHEDVINGRCKTYYRRTKDGVRHGIILIANLEMFEIGVVFSQLERDAIKLYNIKGDTHE